MNVKKMIFMIAVFGIAAASLPVYGGQAEDHSLIAHAENFENNKCGDDLTFTLTEDGVLTVSGKGAMYDSTNVNKLLWKGKEKSIKKVIIENGVTSIGADAFSMCKALTSVTLADTVKEIGTSAFRGCTWLKEINIPDGITSINDRVFAECNALEKIEFPDSLTNIGDQAFAYSRLRNITFPDSVTSIGVDAFFCCYMRSVTLPPSVAKVSSGAFAHTPVKEIFIMNPECEFIELKGYNRIITNGISFDEDNNVSDILDVKIYGYADSTAQVYAEKYGYSFKVIGDPANRTAGDANCDENVDMADVVLVMQALASPDKYGAGGSDDESILDQGIENADVDKSITGLTTGDAKKIQEYLLGLVDTLE